MNPYLLLLLTVISLASGCVYDHISFEDKTFTRFSVLYDAAVSSASFDPATGEIRIDGYKGEAKIDAIIAALEAAK